MGERLNHQRPDCPCQIAAAGADRDRNTAPAHEPERHVSNHRAEAGGPADADQQAVGERELPVVGSLARGGEADPQQDGSERDRGDDAHSVGEPAHDRAAEHESQHHRGVGERRIRPINPEIGLDRRQHDGNRPHGDAADRAEQDRDGQAKIGIGAVYFARRNGADRSRSAHRHKRNPMPQRGEHVTAASKDEIGVTTRSVQNRTPMSLSDHPCLLEPF